MKRFLLFWYECFYPNGGLHEFHGDFDSIENALAAVRAENPPQWVHILDTQTGEMWQKCWEGELEPLDLESRSLAGSWD